ncbi:hypothetical protein BDZ89DRAFT_515595 [Hymenopellis radicata]|nr:hypothetical protein BDZ89DRAFT_515595 [Hymenopellis radicata]
MSSEARGRFAHFGVTPTPVWYVYVPNTKYPEGYNITLVLLNVGKSLQGPVQSHIQHPVPSLDDDHPCLSPSQVLACRGRATSIRFNTDVFIDASSRSQFRDKRRPEADMTISSGPTQERPTSRSFSNSKAITFQICKHFHQNVAE